MLKSNKPAAFSGSDQEILFSRILKHAHWTTSDLRQLIDYLQDLMRAEKTPLEKIVNKEAFQEILTDQALSPKKRAERLLAELRAFCYPTLSRKEVIWKKGLNALGRPRDIWIPLTRAQEFSDLETALECKISRREAACCWVKKNRSALTDLLEQCSSTDS